MKTILCRLGVVLLATLLLLFSLSGCKKKAADPESSGDLSSSTEDVSSQGDSSADATQAGTDEAAADAAQTGTDEAAADAAQAGTGTAAVDATQTGTGTAAAANAAQAGAGTAAADTSSTAEPPADETPQQKKEREKAEKAAAKEAAKAEKEAAKNGEAPPVETTTDSAEGGTTEDVAPVINTLTGKVAGDATKSMSVVTDAGQSITFSLSATQNQMSDGVYDGDAVTISYTGTIEGADLTAAEIVSVTDNGDNSQNPLRVAAKAAAAEEAREKILSGKIYAVAGRFVSIEDPQGLLLTFMLLPESQNAFPQDMQENAPITVTYTGTVTGTDATRARVVKVSPTV